MCRPGQRTTSGLATRVAQERSSRRTTAQRSRHPLQCQRDSKAEVGAPASVCKRKDGAFDSEPPWRRLVLATSGATESRRADRKGDVAGRRRHQRAPVAEHLRPGPRPPRLRPGCARTHHPAKTFPDLVGKSEPGRRGLAPAGHLATEGAGRPASGRMQTLREHLAQGRRLVPTGGGGGVRVRVGAGVRHLDGQRPAGALARPAGPRRGGGGGQEAGRDQSGRDPKDGRVRRLPGGRRRAGDARGLPERGLKRTRPSAADVRSAELRFGSRTRRPLGLHKFIFCYYLARIIWPAGGTVEVS